MDHKYWMQRAIDMAKTGMNRNAGGPFGAVIVKQDQLIAQGYNEVIANCDPTAHAEIIAIRRACQELGDFQLTDCIIYSSCEPCPMCLGAIYWSRPQAVYFGCDRQDAANIEFDDHFIYEEIGRSHDRKNIPFIQLDLPEAYAVLKAWEDKEDKIRY
ncbi:MAG: nucleoside deaminase [Saprospiraceae bacterium]|nr:nucleoside deaminase [Saprospiraceae bacterium]